MLIGIYIGITLCVFLFCLFMSGLGGGKGFDEVIQHVYRHDSSKRINKSALGITLVFLSGLLNLIVCLIEIW